MKLQFLSTARSRVHHGRSLWVHMHNGLVVLVESDEMRERGHEGRQLGEALPVRARDP